MTTNKVRRCRRIISQPGYWRDRAIQMGETYGDYLAEWFLDTTALFVSDEDYQKATDRYRKRIAWYARKANTGAAPV